MTPQHKRRDTAVGGSPFKLDDFREQCAATWLVLILDEVPWRWTNELYLKVPERLKTEHGFDRVVMLVGGTALNHDVRRQPTSALKVVNIRMKPVSDTQTAALLRKHLSKLRGKTCDKMVEKLFQEMPLLADLLTNHRCASLTAEVLQQLLGQMDDIPRGWCRGHSTTLLSLVANRYRDLCGLKSLTPDDCGKLMLQSMALVAVQPVIEPGHGVEQNHPYLESARRVAESGMVERAILPDTDIQGDSTKVAVDGAFEWQMSPALTLLCATTILPWLEGIYQAPDHFEALVAVLMVALRYAQTGKEYTIRRMAKSVPYQGNESHFFSSAF